MSRMNRPGKKNALLQRKEKLLEELKLCDKQIEKAKQNQTNNNFKYEDSSDSDTELTLRMDKGKSLPSLVRKKSILQTRCNATAELTGLEVLESTVNILLECPEINGESAITEEGVWHEAIAECKVDLIPFTISFYVHQPNRNFGQPSYRCLKVVASKEANERELANSVLSKMKTPSEAFEVLKSYAAAHRSRRTTLARLAEMYGDDLFMTPLSDGGYQLQCANILELSWTLESKPSTVAYFRHRMKLSLEYMDETSLKIITQANKEMSNPSVDTEERTSLLSKIISTCLKAQDNSGSDVSRVQKRPNDAMDIPMAKKKKENEVMGPPKALPKKIKIKNNENYTKEINKSKKNVSEGSNENQVKSNKEKELNKNTEKTKNHVKVKGFDNKIIKNPINCNKEIMKKPNDNKNQDNISKNTLKSDSIENNSKNKTQETDKNIPNKENIEKGKKIQKKVIVTNTKIKGNNEKILSQTKRINLKPNLKMKNKPNIKSIEKTGNTEIYDTKIKPINKRFSDNINKEKTNLQKTKIPMKTNKKMNTFRMSPRTNVKNLTTNSVNSVQKTIGAKSSSNIARLVKKPTGKKLL